MSRFIKVVSLLLLVFLAAGALFAQDQHKKPVWPAYVFSLALGFGSGHYYLGENGTPFLIGDAIGLSGMIAGDVVALGALLSEDFTNPSSVASAEAGITTGYGILIAGTVVYLISHIWEIIDIFDAVDRAEKAGRVAEVVPVFNVQRTAFEAGALPLTSYELGVTLKY